MLGTIGMPELLIILVLVLIVFGAGKLPDVMGSLGQGVKEFRVAAESEGKEPGEGAGTESEAKAE